MRLPFRKNRNAEKAAAQARTARGTFATPERESAVKVREVLDQAKQIETESQMFSGIAKGMTAIEELVQARQKTIDDAITLALEDYEPDGHGEDTWAPLIKELVPLFKDYIMKMGATGATLSPGALPSSHSPPSPRAPPPPTEGIPSPAPIQTPIDVMSYMKLAAQAHKVPGGMTALKAALPTAFSEMEKQGIDPEVFKQAALNISKVLK